LKWFDFDSLSCLIVTDCCIAVSQFSCLDHRHCLSLSLRGSRIWAWLPCFRISHEARIKVWIRDRVLPEGLTGESFTSRVVGLLAGFSSWQAFGMTASVSHWLGATGFSGLYRRIPHHIVQFSKVQTGENLLTRQNTVSCTIIMEGDPIVFLHSVGQKWVTSPAHTQRSMRTRGGIFGLHLKVYLQYLLLLSFFFLS
jgi:hypothetical protein